MDLYLGATEMAEEDPLNSVFPGEFRYGGGHVIEDLVAGNVDVAIMGVPSDMSSGRPAWSSSC